MFFKQTENENLLNSVFWTIVDATKDFISKTSYGRTSELEFFMAASYSILTPQPPEEEFCVVWRENFSFFAWQIFFHLLKCRKFTSSLTAQLWNR